MRLGTRRDSVCDLEGSAVCCGDGIAVHLRVIKAWGVKDRDNVCGRRAPEGLFYRNLFGGGLSVCAD